MSAQAAALARSWRVGRYSVTLTIPKPQPGASACAAIEWAPSQPKRLSATELKQYRMGRNEAIAELSRVLGITVAVVDL